MLDKAFESLKTYDWGVDPKVLGAIDEAIVSTHGDVKARQELEKRLAAVLASDVPQAAKDAVCRALRTIGAAASVPALAGLLADEKLSHMARYALQAIPAPEATQALLAALPEAPAKMKIGIASSLGVRSKDVPPGPLASLLTEEDPAVSRAGAQALGSLGSPEAGKALSAVSAKATGATKAAIADSLLECAENLLAAGSKAEARASYEKILASNPSKAVKTAATLGIAASS